MFCLFSFFIFIFLFFYFVFIFIFFDAAGRGLGQSERSPKRPPTLEIAKSSPAKGSHRHSKPPRSIRPVDSPTCPTRRSGPQPSKTWSRRALVLSNEPTSTARKVAARITRKRLVWLRRGGTRTAAWYSQWYASWGSDAIRQSSEGARAPAVMSQAVADDLTPGRRPRSHRIGEHPAMSTACRLTT